MVCSKLLHRRSVLFIELTKRRLLNYSTKQKLGMKRTIKQKRERKFAKILI
jgi:hypothetical protein